MKQKTIVRLIALFAGVQTLVFFTAVPAHAHCDTMNGPVVRAAQRALETNDVNLVLIWVQQKDEAIIREAFAGTMAVRKQNPASKKLADMYFFETLVRVHRAGEGAPYTGLKPAESEVEPGIEAADNALEKGKDEELLHRLNDAVQHGIHDHFANALAKQKFDKDDVEAGRAYVRAYVEFIHYAEQLFKAAAGSAGGHLHEVREGAGQRHVE